MSGLRDAKWLLLGLTLVACVIGEKASAGPCTLDLQVLVERQSGPFKVEVLGSRELCIEAAGDANLAPYTATVRVTNTSATPVAVAYTSGVPSAFRSVSFWPAEQPEEAVAFTGPAGYPGSGTSVRRSLSTGERFLVSSSTQHHQAIWAATQRGSGPSHRRDFVVQFALAFGYDSGEGQRAVAEGFDVVFTAVPADEHARRR